MKKILIIAYYFPPLGWSGVQRTLKYVKYLREFGWEPVVVTVGETPFNILDTTLEEDLPVGVEVIRINDYKLKDITDSIKKDLFQRSELLIQSITDTDLLDEYKECIDKVLGQLRDLILIPEGNVLWCNNVIQSIEEKVNLKEIQLVYTTSAPYSAHLIGYELKNKYNIPWVADFRDEWSNNPYYEKDVLSLRGRVELHLEQNIVSTCDALITISDMAVSNFIEKLNLDPQKGYCITNGYDEEDFSDIKSSNTKNEVFTIIHNGTFYLKINPYTVLQGINELIQENKIENKYIRLKCIGKIDGEIEEELIKKDVFKIIQYETYLSHKESLRQAIKADLLLLIVGAGEYVKSVYTGKVFEYLRMRKPILALTPQESVVSTLLKETHTGKSVEYQDIESIKKVILENYRDWKNKKTYIYNGVNVEKYERKNLTQKLAQILDSLM